MGLFQLDRLSCHVPFSVGGVFFLLCVARSFSEGGEGRRLIPRGGGVLFRVASFSHVGGVLLSGGRRLILRWAAYSSVYGHVLSPSGGVLFRGAVSFLMRGAAYSSVYGLVLFLRGGALSSVGPCLFS